MPHSAAQIDTLGQTVMVGSPADPKRGARVTECIFVNNPSPTDPVGLAVIVYNASRATARVIHEGDLESRESLVIDSPIEITAPEQLRLRVDSMADPPINYYVHWVNRQVG